MHIVNSLRFICTAIETWHANSDGAAPAASARTICAAQLPVPSDIALANVAPSLHVPLARAMLIRTADEDWGILRGAV